MPQDNLLKRIITLDKQLSARLAIPIEARLLRLAALALAHSGDSPLWLLGAAVIFILAGAAGRDFGWRILAGTLISGALTTILKQIFRRHRPPGEGRGFYSRFDRHAFPSGHAGRSVCLVVLLIPLLPPWGSALLTLWVGLVGLARVALQVHFATDILGGWAVGLLTGGALLAIF